MYGMWGTVYPLSDPESLIALGALSRKSCHGVGVGALEQAACAADLWPLIIRPQKSRRPYFFSLIPSYPFLFFFFSFSSSFLFPFRVFIAFFVLSLILK